MYSTPNVSLRLPKSIMASSGNKRTFFTTRQEAKSWKIYATPFGNLQPFSCFRLAEILQARNLLKLMMFARPFLPPRIIIKKKCPKSRELFFLLPGAKFSRKEEEESWEEPLWPLNKSFISGNELFRGRNKRMKEIVVVPREKKLVGVELSGQLQSYFRTNSLVHTWTKESSVKP